MHLHIDRNKHSMSIKVLVISDYRSFHTARPEAEIFIGLAKKGFEVHVMTYPDEMAEKLQKEGVKFIDFHPQKKFDRTEIAFIRQWLLKEQYDILHLTNSSAIINGIKAARDLPIKIVLYRGYTGNIHWYDPLAYFKYLDPRVDKIICNSKGVRDHLHKQFFFDKSKTITINKGHKIEWYSAYPPIDIRSEFEIPKDALLLVTVANNRRMKGIPYLLRAINQLPADLPIHLLLIGNNMDRPQNLAILDKGPNRSKVHFPGFRKNVLNMVAASDVFVLPSIKGESITKSAIEAMSLGIAPIITRIPGNVELVIHQESGLTVAPKDPSALQQAILNLYENPTFRRQLAENAQKRIDQHLNNDQTIEQVAKLYQSLVGNKTKV